MNRSTNVFLLLVFLYVITARQIEKEKVPVKKKCGFLKSLVDKNCAHPKIENGLSMKVDKERCWSKYKSESIREHGCITVKIVNKVCRGFCNSVWMPGNDFGQSACFGCFPSAISMRDVVLLCPNRATKMINKSVPIIKQCSCQRFSCGPVMDGIERKKPVSNKIKNDLKSNGLWFS